LEIALITLVAGDALEAIPKLVEKGVLVDSVVTDPPYHLTATVKGLVVMAQHWHSLEKTAQ
jgi:DNA modification methylase